MVTPIYCREASVIGVAGKLNREYNGKIRNEVGNYTDVARWCNRFFSNIPGL